jgi:dihydroneopterin aldolase
MRVGIKDLQVLCIIGCLPEERENPQVLLTDLSLELPPPSKDALSETVDYTKVAKLIEDTARQGRFFLLETLASEIAKNLLNQFLQITSLKITIKKPKAIKNAAYSFVELEYGR